MRSWYFDVVLNWRQFCVLVKNNAEIGIALSCGTVSHIALALILNGFYSAQFNCVALPCLN